MNIDYSMYPYCIIRITQQPYDVPSIWIDILLYLADSLHCEDISYTRDINVHIYRFKHKHRISHL